MNLKTAITMAKELLTTKDETVNIHLSALKVLLSNVNQHIDEHPLIIKAREFALTAHNVQKYSNIYPYYKHSEDVYLTLLKADFDQSDKHDLPVLVASWLHDCLEDTNTSYSDIKREFEEEIAEIVYCVTDEVGRNRKERHQKTFPKLITNTKAVTLKVADRLSNVKFGIKNQSPQFMMYKKEFTEFKECIEPYIKGVKTITMWQELCELLNYD